MHKDEPRYYARRLTAPGFPVCHFVMDRTIRAAVDIRSTATAAKKRAQERNDG